MASAPQPEGVGVAGRPRRCCGTASGLGQSSGRPGLAVRPPLRVGGLQLRPTVVGSDLGPAGSARRCEPSAAARSVPVGGGVAAADGGGLRELGGLAEGARVVSVGALGGQTGDLAGVALESFQHGQHRQGNGGGDGLGDQVGLGVGDVAADRGYRAAADQQPAIADPASIPSGSG